MSLMSASAIHPGVFQGFLHNLSGNSSSSSSGALSPVQREFLLEFPKIYDQECAGVPPEVPQAFSLLLPPHVVLQELLQQFHRNYCRSFQEISSRIPSRPFSRTSCRSSPRTPPAFMWKSMQSFLGSFLEFSWEFFHKFCRTSLQDNHEMYVKNIRGIHMAIPRKFIQQFHKDSFRFSPRNLPKLPQVFLLDFSKICSRIYPEFPIKFILCI